MINMYVSLKELNRLYQKMGTKADAKQTSLFRVRTGLKSGDAMTDLMNECANKLAPLCREHCESGGFPNYDPDVSCSCTP